MTADEYDAATCITAGELRATGFAVADTVPDCAWIRRSAMRVDVGGAHADPRDRARIVVPIGVTFEQPFRWIEVSAEDGAALAHRSTDPWQP